MPSSPQSIEVIREKLRSADERTRITALLHAGAHGPAARVLLPNVLRLYEDPSHGVQQTAVSTFERIGVGADEAAPALLALLDRSSGRWPANMIARSFVAIGPAARRALPKLKQFYRSTAPQRLLLDAMVKIDAADPEVIEFVLEAAFGSDTSLALSGSRALKEGDGFAIEFAFARIRADAGGTDTEGRVAAARVLGAIAEKRPEEAARLAAAFLADPSAPEASAALRAITKLPRPLPSRLIQGAIDVVTLGSSRSRHYAISVLDEIGAEARDAQPVLLQIIRDNAETLPVPGERGWPAGDLSRAAKALAQHFPTADAIEPLLRWLSGVAHRRTPMNVSFEDKTFWSPVGEVVVALTLLAPRSAAAHSAIIAAIESSRHAMNADPTGVLDFHRTVGGALTKLPNAAEMISRARQAGMTIVDRSGDDEVSQELDDLPPLPEDDDATSPQPGHSTTKLNENDLSELDRLSALGREYLGVSATAAPREIADAVNAWLNRARYTSDATAIERALEVGLVFGEAVRGETIWEWRWYRFGDRQEPALVSDDQAYLLLPTHIVARNILLKKEITILALFNMLAAKILPPSAPGAFLSLG